MTAPAAGDAALKWPDGEAGKQLIEHLKLIQAIITRQNHSAFVVKGWSVTVTGAVLAFAMLHPKLWWLAFLGVVSSGVCWWLDAHFLHFERQYRCLYRAVQELKPVPAFSMDPTKWVTPADTTVSSCMRRSTVWLIHAPMVLFAGVAAFVSLCTPP